MKLLKLLCFMFLFHQGKAQNIFKITGVIKDKEGLAIPAATVLLSGYKLTSVANSEGKFIFNNIKAGNYNLLIQIIGYLPANKNVIISSKPIDIEIRLTENVHMLNEVRITSDPHRQEWLNTFKECFIGTSPNAKKCRIVNPDVLQFDYDQDKQILNAKADEFLIIENMALGYRIKYLLKHFEKNEKVNVVFFYGYPSFEEIKGSMLQNKTFDKNRKTAYQGSPEHFFSSLYRNTYLDEGFIVNKLVKKLSHKKPPDSIMTNKIQTYTEKTAKSGSWEYVDSLNYWTNLKNEADTLEILNINQISTDQLIKEKSATLKTVISKDALYVVFTKEKESIEYELVSGFKIIRPKNYSKYQISIIYHNKDEIDFYKNGSIDNSSSVAFEGYWAYEKVADMVPLDYFP